MRLSARVAAVVLAAGRSRRTGAVNKLLVRTGESTIVERAVDAVLPCGLHETIVVTGYQSEALRETLGERALRFVHNAEFASGMSTSLNAGIAALAPSVDAALVCLADMPNVTSALLRRVVTAYDPAAGRAIVVPCYAKRRGNPVLWDRRFFRAMRAIEGDVGAKALLSEHAAQVFELPTDDPAVLMDVDTPDQLDALR